MKENQQEVSHNRGLTRQFLFSKTESMKVDDKAGKGLSFDSIAMKEKFPDILQDQEFSDYALKRLGSSSIFGAIIVQPDEPSDNTEESKTGTSADVLTDLAGIIDDVCTKNNGFWGRMGTGMFGCFFLEADKNSCLKIAEKIKCNVADKMNGTVTAGIALYPTIDFDKDRILGNAHKALHHAAFFGPGSSVVFDTISLNISGDRLYQDNNINGAIEEFKAALLLDPVNVNVHNSLGVCYGVLGNFEKALEHFQQAIEIDPKEAMSLYNAGIVNVLTNKKDEALDLILKAESEGEDIFEVALEAGKIYLEKKDFSKAEELIKKALKLKPKSGIAFRYLGECYLAEKMEDKAISAYKNAIKKNPNDAHSLSALGYLFDLQGENPEITTIFCQQSVEIAPDNGLFRNRLGRLYLKQNQPEEALIEFEKAQELGHDSTEFIDKTKDILMEKETK
jgi:tetratricopeptide (TPR) repeat protein